jgi:tetratricopeptide (TPR) repeat protein
LARTATDAFPDELRPLLELVSLARDAGLRAEARRWAVRLLERSARAASSLSRDEGLALFDLLGEDPEALPLLEAVAARFSRDPELQARLAVSYGRLERWLAAARLFEQATRLGGDYAFEAADQYRMAGRHRAALRLGHRVTGEDRRKAQRLVVLFEAGAYARVVALPDPPDDRASLYRRAYAHHALGHRSRAASLARRLLEGPEDAHASSARALLDTLGVPAEAAP